MKSKLKILVITINMVIFSSARIVNAGDIKGNVKVLGGKGLEHVVVYIERVEGKTFSPPTKNAIVDQARMTFVPHVLPLLSGSTVAFPNSDSTRHNVFSPSKTKKFNLGTYPAGITKKVTFEKTGVVSLLCNVHPEMSAFILVLQNPYFAIADKQGKYKISDVPPGDYTFVVWHPKFKSKNSKITIRQEGSVTVDFFLDE
ncbi:MAG TPA: carboxypeptidase regulatory-like domain-containing protein [Patescibacteria group bacterium]|nr:carboxypeptidase regulatory-like domain-containing protein [Patescibacteria group bacterium]